MAVAPRSLQLMGPWRANTLNDQLLGIQLISLSVSFEEPFVLIFLWTCSTPIAQHLMPNSCYTPFTPTSVCINNLLANNKYPHIFFSFLLKEAAAHPSTWKRHILLPDRLSVDLALPRRVICLKKLSEREKILKYVVQFCVSFMGSFERIHYSTFCSSWLLIKNKIWIFKSSFHWCGVFAHGAPLTNVYISNSYSENIDKLTK